MLPSAPPHLSVQYIFFQFHTVNSGGSRIFLGGGGGSSSQNSCADLLFCKLFAKNSMKIKEFDPTRGTGRASLALP